MTEWRRAASASAVGPRPLAVVVDDVPLVLVRFAAADEPVAFADHCPHRLVPLSAGTLVGGALRCAYHGWEFTVDGRCVALPSAGPTAVVPPRANLAPGPRTRTADGAVWVHGGDLAALAAPPRDLLTNESPGLAKAWHPVALAAELPVVAELLGRPWALSTVEGEVTADPVPYGIQERWGIIWLAPEEPRAGLFTDPDAEDAGYVGAWLPPARTTAPAGFAADNFLDVAHFPFVHAGTFGAGEEKVVPPCDVAVEPDGARSVQEQWFDNPEDPGVSLGIRPLRQRRRATYVYRAPFQLMLRLEELDAGAVKTILFFLQPERIGSTRIYTKMLLHGIGGVARPGPEVVAREVAFEEAVLAEDLQLQSHIRLPGLPLRTRDELHVRADLIGVTLRRHLRPYA